MRRTVLVACLLAALLPAAGHGARRARQEGKPVTPDLLPEAQVRSLVRQALLSAREEYNFARQKPDDARAVRALFAPLAGRSGLLGYSYDPGSKKAAAVFDATAIVPAPSAAAQRRAERALKSLITFSLTRFSVTIDKVTYLPMGAGDAASVEVAIKWAPDAAPDAAALRREIAELTQRLQMAQARLAAMGNGAGWGVAPGSLSWPAYGPNYWPQPINWSWGCGASGPYSWGYPPGYWGAGQPSYYPAAFGWGGLPVQPPLAYPWWGYRAPAFPGPAEAGTGAVEAPPVEVIDVKRLKPADSTRLYWKGHELYWAREHAQAREYFLAAAKLKMRDARMWYFKGLTELAVGDDAAAAESFKQGAELERLGMPGPEAVGLALERIQGATRAKIRAAQEEAGR